MHQTIADGIAVKSPGDQRPAAGRMATRTWSTVEEAPIAEAMVFLLERSKLLVEGAGAVGVAALMDGVVEPAAQGTTVAILSGGNIDLALLAALATRQETAAGRRVRLFTRVSDQPGGLAGLLSAVADQNANLIQIEHVRDGIDLAVRETGVELTLETQGTDHAEALVEPPGRRGLQRSGWSPPAEPAAAPNRRASAAHCSASSGGSWTSKSTPRNAIRSASHSSESSLGA